MKYSILSVFMAFLMLVSPVALAKDNLDPLNNNIYLVSSINPTISDFFSKVPDLCDDDFFRITPFDDFDTFCRKIEYDPVDVYYDHNTCDINFYNDFERGCLVEYIQISDQYDDIKEFCESDIFDELDDFCDGRDFSFDYEDQLRQINKGGQVFSDDGNLIGHMQYVPYVSKNITDKIFVPTYDYQGYKDNFYGLSYDRNLGAKAYGSNNHQRSGYLNYGTYRQYRSDAYPNFNDYAAKSYRNWNEAWNDYPPTNYRVYDNVNGVPISRSISPFNDYYQTARYFNDPYYNAFHGVGSSDYASGCITCANYGL